jgi:TatA/E family protein of Tat protein translocase
MFENVGGGELLVILFVIFLFFGPNKIPEIGKNIGKGMREIRKAMNSVRKDIEDATKL